MNYIPFKVLWDIQGSEENLDIYSDGPNLQEGIIYWRRDQILGFNNGGDNTRTQLILEIDKDIEGNIIRFTFTVDETLEEVAKKLNDG